MTGTRNVTEADYDILIGRVEKRLEANRRIAAKLFEPMPQNIANAITRMAARMTCDDCNCIPSDEDRAQAIWEETGDYLCEDC